MNLKVFDSLKCALCKMSFSPFAHHHLSPRKLGCGLAMCNDCFETEKRRKTHRKHQCDHGNCFHNTRPAHFLIDIVSQDSLKLSKLSGGYYLPFNIPKCPICGDKYSHEIAGKKSFVLNCNHMICTKCYQTKEKKRAKMNEWKFTIKCPTCRFETNSEVHMRKDLFQSFLFELSEMNSQLDTVHADSNGRCDERFKLAEKNLTKIQQSVLDRIQASKDFFQDLYRQFFEPLQKKLLSNMQDPGNCTLDKLKEKQQKSIELMNSYDRINEEHAHYLQSYGAKMEKLSRMLDG